MSVWLDIAPVFLGIWLMQVSPGPNLAAVSANALARGRAAGLATAAGVASGVMIWALLFTFGIGALIAAFPASVTAMKLLGGSYLLYLGLRALRGLWNSRKGLSAPPAPAPRNAFATGLLVVLTNPKAMLMWVAVSTYLAAAALSAPQFLAIGGLAALSAFAIYGFYALVFSSGSLRRGYARVFRIVDAAFGLIFGALGGKLLLDALREMRA